MKKLCLVYVLTIMPTYVSARYILPTSFDQAMISSSSDVAAYKNFLKNTPHKELLGLIEQQYYHFANRLDRPFSQKTTIPKIIHQIWIGPHEFPESAKEWQKTWRALHSDWEYKLWTNEEVEQFDFENKKYFNQAKNWGEKADILRYEILCRFGGVYVDVDFECFQSFDCLHHICDFYAGIHAVPLLFKDRLRINNGLIAAKPQHPILEYAVQQIPYFRDKKGVAQRTGPDFFTQVIQTMLPTTLAAGSCDVIFPANFFYPSGPKSGAGFSIKPGNAYIQPETLAVHYYTAYWIRPPKKGGGLYWAGRSRRARRHSGRVSKRRQRKQGGKI